jgi:hypothetical protein
MAAQIAQGTGNLRQTRASFDGRGRKATSTIRRVRDWVANAFV